MKKVISLLCILMALCLLAGAAAETVPETEAQDGIIAVNFPDYDTGVDADYSYQSDDLRIAITVVEDEEECQKYYVADIWVRSLYFFRCGFANGKFSSGTEDAESFVQRERAILGVNGVANIGCIFHNGQRVTGFDRNDQHTGIAVLYTDGTMKVYNRSHFSLTTAAKRGIWHIWHFGPALVSDGEMTTNFNARGTRHPRTIIGYYEPGHYCLVVVDGRSKTAIGMTNRDMAELMLELGCQEALNLDGGNSSMMVFMGEVISHPSGEDKDGDGKGDRRQRDMLLFAEYDEEGNALELDQIDMGRVKIQ